MAGSPLRLHHNDLALRIASDGVCLHVIASPGRWHWRTADVDCVVIAASSGLAELALGIIRDNCADFGPTLACEKLAELHDVVLAKETRASADGSAGLWIPGKCVRRGSQQPRYRRACVGELIQIDGCDHRWFEERGPACTLLVYVDDATSRLMQLHFVKSESTFTYFDATRGYLEQHGKTAGILQRQGQRVSHLTTKMRLAVTARRSSGVR